MKASGAKRYFEDFADNFNSYYQKSRIPILGPLKSYLWRDLEERERLALKLSAPLKDKSFLDIGCGDGHYSKAILAAGARSYFGVDFYEEMIRQAKDQYAGSQVQFEMADFVTYPFQERFDHLLAMGVMDYVAQPKSFLEKALSLTNQSVVVSFPQKTLIRGSIRHVKYRLRSCPIYLYSLSDILNLLNAIESIDAYKILPIAGVGMDFVVKMTPQK